MHITKQAFNAIMLNYKDCLIEHEKNFNAMKEKIYKGNPTLLDDEYKLKELRMKKVRLSISDCNTKSLDLEINQLSKKIEDILKNYNLNTKTFNTSYFCNKCKDTGYINNQMCKCLKKYAITYTYETSHLKEQIEKENFKTFNLNYYSDEKLSKMPFSPRDNAKMVLSYAMDYCKRFETMLDKKSLDKFNILFYGMPGLGKTFLCNAIAKEILDECYSAIYYSSCELSKIILDAAFNHGYDSDIATTYALENIYDADLLIIDDLGTEPNNSTFTSELFSIINTRQKAHRPTIISTNLDMRDLRDKYTERISSRFLEGYEIFKLMGTNIREIKYNN